MVVSKEKLEAFFENATCSFSFSQSFCLQQRKLKKP